ncbi:MAG: glycosidase, partial [Balneolales bacterium]
MELTVEKEDYDQKLQKLKTAHELLLSKLNQKKDSYNGIYDRYKNPVLTADHVPLYWRFDFDRAANSNLMERLGVGAVCNAGAMKWKGKYLLVGRVEGYDRKSIFGIAESPNGIDNFRFWDYPINLPETEDPDTNTYDMRLIDHEDGWIYGVFCTERKDPEALKSDTSAAMAQAGIARTKDLVHWERLPDLKSKSKQQRNVVLHPEFVDGKYAFYTR